MPVVFLAGLEVPVQGPTDYVLERMTPVSCETLECEEERKVELERFRQILDVQRSRGQIDDRAMGFCWEQFQQALYAGKDPYQHIPCPWY